MEGERLSILLFIRAVQWERHSTPVMRLGKIRGRCERYPLQGGRACPLEVSLTLVGMKKIIEHSFSKKSSAFLDRCVHFAQGVAECRQGILQAIGAHQFT